jgi:hypothetical protein
VGDGSHFIETAPHNDTIVRVAFAPSGFRHRIESLRAGEAIASLAEIESPEAAPWPPCPPWQELHVHEQPAGGQVLMLVGRAGASHWSMAVSRDESQRAIVFDVACRVRRQPEFLGSTYRVSGTQPLAVLVESLAVDEGSKSNVEILSDGVVIRPALKVSPPATIRWKYAVRCAE